MSKHTPGAVKASNQITGCQKVEAGGLSLAGMRNIIDREVSQPFQAHINRLEAEKAELVEALKYIVESWDIIEEKNERSLKAWEAYSREQARAAIAKAGPDLEVTDDKG